MDNLDVIAEQLRQGLIAKDQAREKLLPLCREAIRHSGNAIRAVHRQEFPPRLLSRWHWSEESRCLSIKCWRSMPPRI
jgi:predicted translin family RNA/ssDNA-binding protein